MSKYSGQWESAEDVARSFSSVDADYNRLGDVELDDADVVFAHYDYIGYEGEAIVLVVIDGKLHEVNGSHCSCHGLEGQWSPEPVNIHEFCYRAIHRMDSHPPLDGDMSPRAQAWLSAAIAAVNAYHALRCRAARRNRS